MLIMDFLFFFFLNVLIIHVALRRIGRNIIDKIIQVGDICEEQEEQAQEEEEENM